MTMVEADTSPRTSEIISRETPQLVTTLKDMTDGLNIVRMKVDTLTAKVKEGQFPRKEGLSYLETKHLLLLNYCQSLVYYLLRKAKGLPIQGHPVVKSLVEIRLFLEKIRPIDKKNEYRIKKLSGVSVTRNVVEDSKLVETEPDTKNKDLLEYGPNPGSLLPRSTAPDEGLVYKPPRFAPAALGENQISRQIRNAKRREEKTIRQSGESEFVRSMMDDLEGKPEEVREVVGAESIEQRRFLEKMERRAREEEEIFTRAPLTKAEKNKMKHLKKSRNGLLGLTESFFDEMSLPNEDRVDEIPTGHGNVSSNRGKKFKKRRVNH